MPPQHPVLLAVLVADCHVGQGGGHGVSGAVAVGGVVRVVHCRARVGLQESRGVGVWGEGGGTVKPGTCQVTASVTQD